MCNDSIGLVGIFASGAMAVLSSIEQAQQQQDNNIKRGSLNPREKGGVY